MAIPKMAKPALIKIVQAKNVDAPSTSMVIIS